MLALGVALAGCTVLEPDVLVRVTRSTEAAVDAYVCDAAAPTVCVTTARLLTETNEPSVERTLGLYIDEPTVALNLEFQQIGMFCDALTVPLDDLPLEMTIALPATEAASIEKPASCPDCTPVTCMWTP